MLKTATVQWYNCESNQLKHFISVWMQSQKWDFEDFSLFLEAAKIKLPVTLVCLDDISKTGTFDCIDADDKKHAIRLIFGDIDEYAEVYITQDIETKIYLCGEKTEASPNPRLMLEGRVLKFGEKMLNSYYGRDYCNRKLQLDESHFLLVNVLDPNATSKDGIKKKVLSNLHLIDYYIFSLANSVSVDKVYEGLIPLLGFSDEDIKNCQKIYIAYVEKIDDLELTLSEMNVTYGEMHSYTVKEGDELFPLYQKMRELKGTKEKIEQLKDKYFS